MGAEGGRSTDRQDLLERELLSVRREKVGSVTELFVHGDGDEPNWARVKMDLVGLSSPLVPLRDLVEEDGQLRLVYEKDYIRGAPDVDAEDGRIRDEDAEKLHRYYGLEPISGINAEGEADKVDLPRETRDAKPPAMDEDPESPLAKRRRARAQELGVPGKG